MELALKQPMSSYHGDRCMEPDCQRVGYFASGACREHAMRVCRCKRRKFNPLRASRCSECAKTVRTREERNYLGD